MKTDLVNIVVERQIGAAPDLVYAATADLLAWPHFIRGIDKLELLTNGPVAAGSRFRETRIIFGRTMIEEIKVTIFDPPHRLAFTWDSHGARCVSTAEFLAAQGETRLRYIFQSVPLTVAARMLIALVDVFASSVRAQMQRDLEDIEAEVARRARAKIAPVGGTRNRTRT